MAKSQMQTLNACAGQAYHFVEHSLVALQKEGETGLLTAFLAAASVAAPSLQVRSLAQHGMMPT
jgi:hypothetical protein